jgi:hypothetical protein
MFGIIKAAAKAVVGKAGDTLVAGLVKLTGSLNELSAASPDLERVGYCVAEIELVGALPPRLVVHLTRGAHTHPEAFQAVLASHTGNKTIRAVVALLQQAERVARKIELKGRRCTGLVVELGLPPCVRLRYTPCEETGALCERGRVGGASCQPPLALTGEEQQGLGAGPEKQAMLEGSASQS